MPKISRHSPLLLSLLSFSPPFPLLCRQQPRPPAQAPGTAAVRLLPTFPTSSRPPKQQQGAASPSPNSHDPTGSSPFSAVEAAPPTATAQPPSPSPPSSLHPFVSPIFVPIS
ncbi:vegetative cell wall protein gp1-like isoform X2 [Amaranthus tricolor]|uniref:vegetative cell wall protein gp1-like isoform X2 n=1 Tax=Amaranthus tricolor TaxID=29722 RepID=UPI00258A57DE|nr:vegetative cell wall protein gp1-like isoform X2 [Amaranthus tricolor]